MFSGRRIVLGVTGGIAAYKSVFLLREFQKSGAEVRVMMTPSAIRFVGVETFRALSRHEVSVTMFNTPEGGEADGVRAGAGVRGDVDAGVDGVVAVAGACADAGIVESADAGIVENGEIVAGKTTGDHTASHWTRHIEWGEWADVMVIAPCTANTLSDIVHGKSDNMLLATLLAARSPVVLCPTMDGEMIRHPAVVRNLSLAEELGYTIVEPEQGYLASGLEDKGRLPEPDRIMACVAKVLERKKSDGVLSGKQVLVTAGPTREFMDPVRFFSNPSSGKMGLAMADAAASFGGDVTLLRGPGVGDPTERMQTEDFTTASELMDLVKKYTSFDVVIMAAAVSDYRPEHLSEQKLKKSGEHLSLTLVRNPDVLAWLGQRKRENQQLIGFAMETEDLLENARKKLQSKNLDWICANLLKSGESGFQTDVNRVELIGLSGSTSFCGEKRVIAKQILRHIFSE